VWVINPGSPTYPHNLNAQPGTAGVLELESGSDARIVIYDLKTLASMPGLTRRL
jgi:hypothetical protein